MVIFNISITCTQTQSSRLSWCEFVWRADRKWTPVAFLRLCSVSESEFWGQQVFNERERVTCSMIDLFLNTASGVQSHWAPAALCQESRPSSVPDEDLCPQPRRGQIPLLVLRLPAEKDEEGVWRNRLLRPGRSASRDLTLVQNISQVNSVIE